MNVWIVQTAEPLHFDNDGLRPMRAMNLADALNSYEDHVTIWSSNFHHYTKKHRFNSNITFYQREKLEYKLFTSKGYKTHKGISRLIDHIQMAFNLNRMLRKSDKPDVAFIGYPPIEVAWIATRWLKKNKVPYVVDVKDEWPQIILREFPLTLQPLVRLCIFPYYKMMESIFRGASGISSVTQAFLDWCLLITGREQNEFDIVTPTTSADLTFTERELIEAKTFWDSKRVFDDTSYKIYFVGTINNVYNFEPIILATKNSHVQLIIAGDGPQRNSLIEKTKEYDNVILPGWISAAQAYVLAERATVALAPFHDRSDFDMNITNKFYDAMRLGKPMLTSTKGVSGQLLIREQIGKVYSNEPITSFAETLSDLLKDQDMLKEMAMKSREVYVSKYSYEIVYKNLSTHLRNLHLKS